MIGFMFSGWLLSLETSCYKTIHTYNAFCVSISGGFSVPCMLVNSIMSLATNAMGFYTGYFGHVTKYTCILCEYPGGFVLSDD